MLKLFFKEYLSFSKKERTGIFVLLGIIILLLIIPFLFPFFIQQKKYDHQLFEKEIAALRLLQEDSSAKFHGQDVEKENSSYYHSSAEKPKNDFSNKLLFDFDPNTLPAEGWRKLGLRDKTIKIIQNYLSKGGKFTRPGDISKIWGLHEDEVQKLMPYIKIRQDLKEDKQQHYSNDYTAYKPKKEINKIVDVNNADTTALIALPGIGNKLAGRIISFRDKLGGFYKIEQVAETFGLPDSTYQKIKTRLSISEPIVKRLNINNATAEEMRVHPYLRYAIANAIVQYRTQHGNFSAITDIKKVLLVTEDVFNKVAPYLAVE